MIRTAIWACVTFVLKITASIGKQCGTNIMRLLVKLYHDWLACVFMAGAVWVVIDAAAKVAAGMAR